MMKLTEMMKKDLENILGEEITDKDGEKRQIISVTLESDDIDTNLWIALETTIGQGNGSEYIVDEVVDGEHWGRILEGKERSYGEWIEFIYFDDFDELIWLFEKYDIDYRQICGISEDIEKVKKFIEDNNLSVEIR